MKGKTIGNIKAYVAFQIKKKSVLKHSVFRQLCLYRGAVS